jgi:hypothetical protein
MMYYSGKYTENGQEFTAEIITRVHTHTPNMISVFGVDTANIKVAGKSNGNSAQVKGSAKEAPGVTFEAELTLLP